MVQEIVSSVSDHVNNQAQTTLVPVLVGIVSKSVEFRLVLAACRICRHQQGRNVGFHSLKLLGKCAACSRGMCTIA